MIQKNCWVMQMWDKCCSVIYSMHRKYFCLNLGCLNKFVVFLEHHTWYPCIRKRCRFDFKSCSGSKKSLLDIHIGSPSFFILLSCFCRVHSPFLSNLKLLFSLKTICGTISLFYLHVVSLPLPKNIIDL